ncbi:phosphatidate cytidyltransferase [Klebsormidium nitens]|uniref:Phosphatidate cytidylyltransferase n=1 Tax=Klebsormidium nitens TaxID=105231 RepID=A0A1Y1HIJ6_KLENI|nr:phosphatidate cytidyltransferase [Klebsormidium nitens]|eukprot:GAQ78320.1 phosphatidate cytidyltransferase [Klebsormidium nitens]
MSAAKAAVQACRVGINPFGNRQSLSVSSHTSTLPHPKRRQLSRQQSAFASLGTHQWQCASSGRLNLEAAGLSEGLAKRDAGRFSQWWGGRECQGRNEGRRRPACVGASAEGQQTNEEPQPAKDSPLEAVTEAVTKKAPAVISNLANRLIFGTLIGVVAGSVVIAGGWWFTLVLAVVQVIGSQEYFNLVKSKAMVKDSVPPPTIAIYACNTMAFFFPIITMYCGGRIGVALTTTAFVLMMVLLLQPTKPRFSQFTTTVFGLFYTSYLPVFWIKLRMLNAPALNSVIVRNWPILLGGPAHWTVGLIATLISFACIIAADVGAYFGGKTFGKTPLTDVSPKKTVEGAIMGLLSSIVVAVALGRLFNWPVSMLSSATLATLIFIASLFGDLTESMIKRDAEVKDSGDLIPGHGGILDRVDSYVFTGALVYSFVKLGLPLFGL